MDAGIDKGVGSASTSLDWIHAVVLPGRRTCSQPSWGRFVSPGFAVVVFAAAVFAAVVFAAAGLASSFLSGLFFVSGGVGSGITSRRVSNGMVMTGWWRVTSGSRYTLAKRLSTRTVGPAVAYPAPF